MYSIKNIVYALIITFLIVNIIINAELKEKIKKFLNKKIGKSNFYIKDFVIGIIIVIIVFVIGKFILTTVDNFKFINTSVESQEEILKESNEKAENSRSSYKEIISKIQTDLEKCKNPYIPEGFKYIEGKWNTGFVIEDENKNQYVWIPCCSRKNNEGINVLEKRNFVASPGISYFYCYEDDSENIEFLKSSLENGGFYISRYEIGNEDGVAVSKAGVKIWNNISFKEAKEISNNMYTSITSSLINGYAYDTAFNFIVDEIENRCENKSTGITGTKSYKNIYDIVDDMCEITSEMQYNFMVFRGIISDNKYIEDFVLDNRFSADVEFVSENLGFRVVLY